MYRDYRHQESQKPPVPVFLATTIVLFFLTLSAADSVGFVPDYIDGSTSLATGGPTVLATGGSTSLATGGSTVLSAGGSALSLGGRRVAVADLPMLGEESTSTVTSAPVRIHIPSIDLNLPVQDPDTRNVDALDAKLVNGPAHYVDSAELGEDGNVLIFAHSSHLPIVHNQMFRAFNRIPELKAGDTITLDGEDGTQYVYSVESVRKADATEAVIDLSPTLGRKLTLVTCDTLTSKTSRYILTAQFVAVL